MTHRSPSAMNSCGKAEVRYCACATSKGRHPAGSISKGSALETPMANRSCRDESGDTDGPQAVAGISCSLWKLYGSCYRGIPHFVLPVSYRSISRLTNLTLNHEGFWACDAYRGSILKPQHVLDGTITFPTKRFLLDKMNGTWASTSLWGTLATFDSYKSVFVRPPFRRKTRSDLFRHVLPVQKNSRPIWNHAANTNTKELYYLQ